MKTTSLKRISHGRAEQSLKPGPSALALARSTRPSRLTRPKVCLDTLALLLATFACAVQAQNYSIGWYKVSGGGGASSGGQFSVTGTIGQADSTAAMTGGSFSLAGGFWSFLSLPPASGPSAPVITSIPSGGTVGEEIVITGENLAGATAVTFDGIAASFTVNSPTQITATVPAGATSGQISVTTPGGTAESTASFTVLTTPAPTLAVVPSPPESGWFVFRLSGIPGKTYWVQTSTDLLTWMNVSTNVLSTSSANVTNAVNAAWNRQFWRAAQLP